MNDAPPPRLDDDAVRAALSDALRHWTLRDDAIERHYPTGGWRASLMIANAIGHLAEAAWHHPDLIVTYPGVTVRLQTHEAGGISARDIELARHIEALVLWQPPAGGSALTGLPAGGPAASYVRSG